MRDTTRRIQPPRTVCERHNEAHSTHLGMGEEHGGHTTYPGMVGVYHGGYTTTLPPWVYHRPPATTLPSSSLLAGYTLLSDEALGSRRRIPVGERPLRAL